MTVRLMPSADVDPEAGSSATARPFGISLKYGRRPWSGAVATSVGVHTWVPGSGSVTTARSRTMPSSTSQRCWALGVLIGPAVVLTNDRNPRAVDWRAGRLKGRDDWQQVGVTIGDGASIGAQAVCVAPVEVGRWAMSCSLGRW